MREQLIQYVSLLFAGAENCEDTKQEILQNTLDRYDDLIAQGKAEEAAYRLAITGIGDINEILGRKDTVLPAMPVERVETDTAFKKLLRAIAVGLYILCPLPLFVLGEMGMNTFGLCGTLCFVAVATVLIILGSKKSDDGSRQKEEDDDEPKSELGKSISGLKTGKVGDAVVGAYKAVEDTVVSGYKQVADAFVDAFLEKTGDSKSDGQGSEEAE